jgi:hypothetical protein
MAKDVFLVSVLMSILIVVILIFGFNLTGYITGFFIAGPDQDIEGFAKCLTENGAVLYTSPGHPRCNEQKEMFGEAMKHIENVDCFADPNVCSENGIQVVPTWIIKNERYEGVQSFERLSGLTGCSLNE